MIPVFEPLIGEEEIEAVESALRKGEISGTFGDYIRDFEQGFSNYCDCEFGIAVSNGTTALHLAVAATDIGAGDEVLVSACTNIATALAVYHNGAVPVPVDSEEITWNLNLDLIDDLVTSRTKAIIPVHIYGHPVEMRKLLAIARKHNLMVIEDCAEAHGATCDGRKTGSFGDMGCFSFYANKVITTGEGGMIVTNNAQMAEKLRLLRNLAFTTPRFKHELAGYNFRMTGYQAAMGLAQLKKIEEIIAEKRRIANTYNQYLEGVEQLQLPVEMEWAKNVYWMYCVIVKKESGFERDNFADFLKENGVDSRTFFCPMDQQPFLQQQPGYRNVSCPVADNLWERGLYLPSSYNLTEDQISSITKHIKNYFS